jgi:hypothetical protein
MEASAALLLIIAAAYTTQVSTVIKRQDFRAETNEKK